MNKEMTLTAKQTLFVAEYLIDLNATQAAIRSGYSKKTAYSAGQRLLKNVEIQTAIQEANSKRLERVGIDAEYVLRRLVEIDQMDILDVMLDDGCLRPISDWPLAWRNYVAGLDQSEIWEGSGDDKKMIGTLKKLKWPDKLKNLELLGKHIKVQAFKEKVEQTVTTKVSYSKEDYEKAQRWVEERFPSLDQPKN